MLNLSLVKSFVGLVEAGSFSGAAEQLKIAQPTLSQHLRKLEQDLGVTLIERGHAGSRPTPNGIRFLPHARHLLSSAQRASEVARDDSIVVGCSGNIASYFIAQEVKDFLDTEQWSGRWDVVSATNPRVAEMLLNREVDLAVMEWPFSHPDVVTQPWKDAEMIVVLPPDHPLAGDREISVRNLLELDLIGGESGSGTGTLLRDVLGEHADKLQTRINVGSTEAVKRAVMSGLGASIVLLEAVRQELEAGMLVGLELSDVSMKKQFYTARSRTAGPDDAATRLARFLSQAETVPSQRVNRSIRPAGR